MKAYHLNGDKSRLRFFNDDNLSDEEELEEIISLLEKGGCIVDKHAAIYPYCDVFYCSLDGVKFEIIYDLDPNYGTIICCFDEQGMKRLEELFEKQEVKEKT